MLILITIISILSIAGAAWLFGRLSGFKVCPICAGVSATWLWMLAADALGYPIDMAVPAMLLGGSVVGIAYQVEKRLTPSHSALLWKLIFIPLGFLAAYALLMRWIGTFAVLAVLLLAAAYAFLAGPGTKPRDPKQVKELEEKMKQCC